MKYPVAISVIIPYYRAGKFITKAVESIIGQSFSQFELIIINDGSDDGVWKRLERYADKRIQLFNHKTNLGNAVRRNEGIHIAKGKYICVMDDDDIAQPDRLFIQYQFMEQHQEVGCIGSQGELIDENDNFIGLLYRPLIYPQIKAFLLKNNFMIHSSLMFRKSFLEKYKLQYDENNQYACDYGLLVKCSELFPLVNLKDRLIKYRIYADQTSTREYTNMVCQADDIRLGQLKKFRIKYSDEGKAIYLNIIKGLPLSEGELNVGIALLNKILDRNKLLKIYSQHHLYDLFSYMIALSQQHLKEYSGESKS